MSGAALRILAPGAWASVQDAGRPGWRAQGVPTGGALHPHWLAAANALVGQAPGAPALEALGGGLTVDAEGAPLTLALTGPCAALLDGQPLPPWRSVRLMPGQRLRLLAPEVGRVAYLAVAGLALPQVLGSASACWRAALGGHRPQEGRPLQAGDLLPIASPGQPPLRRLAEPPPPAETDAAAQPIRALPGPQDDHLPPEQLAVFWASAWTITREADRMGLRLAGPPLTHRPGCAEIATDATVPGAIQLPGHGQPIVLLADGHTAGGYPKIATVCTADLPRLAVAAPGAVLRFAPITADAALALARAAATRWRQRLAALSPLGPALEGATLVSGCINAHDDATWTST